MIPTEMIQAFRRRRKKIETTNKNDTRKSDNDTRAAKNEKN